MICPIKLKWLKDKPVGVGHGRLVRAKATGIDDHRLALRNGGQVIILMLADRRLPEELAGVGVGSDDSARLTAADSPVRVGVDAGRAAGGESGMDDPLSWRLPAGDDGHHEDADDRIARGTSSRS